MDEYREELKAREAKSDDLNLLRLLESRITEIVQIEKEVKKKFPKLFHQRLPRFMRRRAASHNPRRIPKNRRPAKLVIKDRRKLLIDRRKVRYLKNKRVLKRRHIYRNKNKTLLHKWFAKRFKIERLKPGLEQVPLHNNTKNQRNLYRQTLYGCAYLSMAHFIPVRVEKEYCSATIDELNKLALSISGFSFSARALESDRYEAVVHLFAPTKLPESPASKRPKLSDRIQRAYICPCYVTNKNSHLILWLPRTQVDQVIQHYQDLGPLNFTKVQPCDLHRLRLVGPKSREEAMKIAADKSIHQQVLDELDRRLLTSHGFGCTLGRHIEEQNVSFTYYRSEPLAVDLVFRNKAGRFLWHQLIKNKAHLVGGKRDFDNLLQPNKSFALIPDHLVVESSDEVVSDIVIRSQKTKTRLKSIKKKSIETTRTDRRTNGKSNL